MQLNIYTQVCKCWQLVEMLTCKWSTTQSIFSLKTRSQMVACFPRGVTSCLGLPRTEVFPRMQDFQCLNLGRSWENQNDWSPYLANTPKLICWHQLQMLDAFLGPCSAKYQSFSWWLLCTTFDLWQSLESPGTKITLGSVCVLEMSLLCHPLSLRPQWSLCLQYHFFQKHGTFSHVCLLFSHCHPK